MPKSKPQADPLSRLLHEITDMEERLNGLAQVAQDRAEELFVLRSAEGLDAAAWAEMKRNHGLERWSVLPARTLQSQAGLLRRLAAEIARSRQCSTPLSLALVQAEGAGLDAGALVPLLAEQARDFDQVFELDGDCAAVLFCGSALIQAERLAGSMLRRLRQSLGEGDGQALCSAGLVGYGGCVELSAQDIIARARQSLDKARKLGGNRLEVAPPLDLSAAPKSTLVGSSEKHFLFTGKRMPQK